VPRLNSTTDLERFRQKILAQRDPNKPCVTICSGTGCHAYGSEKVYEAFVEEIQRNGLKEKVNIRRTGCHGFCERGTLVVIFPEEICYLRVRPEDAPEIVSTTLIENKIVDRLLYIGDDGNKIVHERDIPFYKHQSRIVFGNNRLIDRPQEDRRLHSSGWLCCLS